MVAGFFGAVMGWVGLGSCPFVVYPSCRGELLPTSELNLNKERRKWMSILEKEQNNQFNFLDITINKNQDGLSFETYRKSTATDIIIPNDICHPREHKTAVIRYYCNRLETYRLTPESRQKEKENIQQILANNKYDARAIEKFNKEKRQRKNEQKQKWGMFTYIGIGTRFITKLFNSKNVKIAFTTNNKIEKRLALMQ